MNSTQKIAALEARIAEHAQRNPTTEHIDALNELAWEMRYRNSKRAHELSVAAREQAENLLYMRGLAYGLRTSAASNWLFASYEAALSEALESLRIFESLSDDYGRAHAMNVVGNVHERLGNHSIAIEFHRKSHHIREEIGDEEGSATSLNNLGNVYSSLGEYASALNNYLESLRLYEKIEDVVGISRALNNIGYIYSRLGDWDKALDHLTKALELKQGIGDRQNEGLVLIHIGNVHESKCDYANALEYYSRGLKVTQEVNDRQNQAASLCDIGNVYRKLGDPQKSLLYYTESLQIAQAVGIRYYEAEALINLGSTLTQIGEVDEALINLARALEISESMNSNDLTYRAHHALSQSYERKSDLPQALDHHKAFHASRERVYSEDSANRIKGVLIQAEIEKSQQEAEIYRLKNVELAKAYGDLHQANEQNSALVSKLRTQTEELDRQSREDALTGLCNRRDLDTQLAHEFSRARRFNRDLTVVMADIDYFKAINDRFSHAAGDEVIKRVARIMRDNCRMIDIVARYGGEEFVLLLIETPPERGAVLCDKIRRAIEDHNWSDIDSSLNVTLSMGIAGDLDVATAEALLAAADAKLYEAKRAGRNLVK